MREAAESIVESMCELFFIFERFMSLDPANVPNAPDNAFEDLERYRWLIQMYDKNIDRYHSSISSLNQKATWTLATAIGFALITGFAKGPSIISAFNNRASNSDLLILLLFLLFALIFFALLQNVLQVYRPQNVEYPVSPLNISKLGFPVSRYKDRGEYGKKCWKDIMSRFFEKDELECLRETLRGYIDSTIEWYLLNQKMTRPLQSAFNKLPILAFLSLFMWLLT